MDRQTDTDTGDRLAMHNPDFPGFEPVDKVTNMAEEAPQKWPERLASQKKPRSPSKPQPAAATVSSSGPFLSPDYIPDSAAGRSTLANGLTSSKSVDQIDWRSRSASGERFSNETKNYKQYHIPLRSGSVSPASIPRSTPAPSPIPVSVLMSEAMQGGIGMALGSPSHPPGSVELEWQPQVMTTITATGTIPEPSPSTGLARSMSKRWNPFSRAKSKRVKPHEDTSPKVSESFTREPSTKEPITKEATTREPTRLMRQASKLVRHQENLGPRREVEHEGERRVMARHKPIVITPPAETQRPALTTAAEPYNGASTSFKHTSRSLTQMGNTMTSQGLPNPLKENPLKDSDLTMFKTPTKPIINQPLLNVDIPAIELERYSVMFDKILQRQSTLPMRRQVKLDRLKLPNAEDFLNDGAPLPLPRRATSPVARNSPTFSLFPQGNAQAAAAAAVVAPVNLPTPSPRVRSNTSPAVVNFPSPAAFKGPAVTKTTTPSVSTPLKNETTYDSPTNAVRPQRLISKFHRKESAAEPTASRRVDEQAEAPRSTPTDSPPKFKTPQWKSNSITDLTVEQAYTRSSPPRQRQQHEQRPSKESIQSDDDVINKALNEAVEISIARQISVSHQQRRLLVPLNGSSSSRNRSGSAPSDAAARLRLGRNKRLVETKSAVPVFVNPDENTQASAKVYRKSSRVVLEAA